MFASGEDPVRFGLITSFARPTGNLTGINFFVTELAAKQLGLMREMIPGAAHVGLLINPTNRNVGDNVTMPCREIALFETPTFTRKAGELIARAMKPPM